MPDDKLTVAQRLGHLAAAMLFRERYPDLEDQVLETLLARAAEIFDGVDDDRTRRSLQGVRVSIDDPVEDNPGHIQDRWLGLLARPELDAWVERAGIPDPGEDFGQIPEDVRHAAARVALGVATDDDPAHLDRWLQATTSNEPEEGPVMNDTHNGANDDRFALDRQNLPEGFDEIAFEQAVEALFEARVDPPGEPTEAHKAHVKGRLLSASYLDPNGPGFEDAFVDYYETGFKFVRVVATGLNGDSRTRRQTYARVADVLERLKGDGRKVTYQELATVADEVIERGPVDDGNFEAKVRGAHDDYVGRTPVYDSLNLPDIVVDDTAQAEVEPANIRAVSMIYAASELEMAYLPTACHHAAQDWTDGVLPVGEAAGQLFDTYVWGSRDRLDPAARQIQFDRIADCSRYIGRFCASLSERDRSQYLSEYLVPGDRQRTAQPRDAAVRKSARDLLAFCSLHGWAYTQFAAKRLGNQIRECVAIMEHPEVQKAYGVQGPWQAVERIATMTTGTVPNVPKHRTLAATGKAIVDRLATKAKAIAASASSQPLFAGVGIQPAGGAVFTQGEYEELVTLAENWLAANGVNDQQRMEQSQIRDSQATGSLPSLGGSPVGGFDSSGVRDQLMNMVNSGQMPTPDQVEQLFRVGG